MKNIYLVNTKDKFSRIRLYCGKNVIGRNKSSHIKNLSISRKQVIFLIDWDSEGLEIKINSCGKKENYLNGNFLEKNSTHKMFIGDVLSLANNPIYSYKLEIFSKILLDESDETKKCYGWTEEKELLILNAHHEPLSSKVASFDLDGTLITTKSGRSFQADYHDWKILSSEVKEKLVSLVEQKFNIFIFSNQLGISQGKLDKNLFKQKVEDIVFELNIPCKVLISIRSGVNRKPCPGMWTRTKSFFPDHEIDISKSFFVGDAAGRPKGWKNGMKKDFSCSDRLFALNIGLNFLTPQEFFKGEKEAPFNLPAFNPRQWLIQENENILKNFKSEECEMILLVGLPASGKTNLWQNYLMPLGYEHVSRDILKTQEKCLRNSREFLVQGRSVAVDNTNLDAASRKKYLDLSRELGVPVRCFHVETSLDQCFHNEKFRELTQNGHSVISKIIFNSLIKKFEEPKMVEGFKEILRIKIHPRFSSEENEKLFSNYLLG